MVCVSTVNPGADCAASWQAFMLCEAGELLARPLVLRRSTIGAGHSWIQKYLRPRGDNSRADVVEVTRFGPKEHRRKYHYSPCAGAPGLPDG